MDVSDLSSVRKAAKTFLQHSIDQPLDMLFLNAGIGMDPDLFEKGITKLPLSKDGIEKYFATNIVGHHLLYRYLEPVLQKSKMARVISTSSVASIWWLPKTEAKDIMIPKSLPELNEGEPSFFTVNTVKQLYGRSKLAQVAWTKALTRRLDDQSTIYVNAAHPGAVATRMLAEPNEFFLPKFVADFVIYLISKILWTSEEGALTELYLGVATDEIRSKNIRGTYFHPVAYEFEHPYANDEVLQDNVWNLCEDLVKKFL